MGVAGLEVDSFTMSSGTEHTWSVDEDLSLLTVRIEGVFSTSMLTLDRPDGNRANTPCDVTTFEVASTDSYKLYLIVFICLIGSTQAFSGSASVDVIGSTTVLSIQVSTLLSKKKYTFTSILKSLLATQVNNSLTLAENNHKIFITLVLCKAKL